MKFVWRLQSEAAAQGTDFVVLQGLFVRSGADVSSVAAANNYTYRRDTVASQGGPQFLATLYNTLPPPKLIPSTYQVSTCGGFLMGTADHFLYTQSIKPVWTGRPGSGTETCMRNSMSVTCSEPFLPFLAAQFSIC